MKATECGIDGWSGERERQRERRCEESNFDAILVRIGSIVSANNEIYLYVSVAPFFLHNIHRRIQYNEKCHYRTYIMQILLIWITHTHTQ